MVWNIFWSYEIDLTGLSKNKKTIMKKLEFRELERTDCTAFLRYAADWRTDKSPFKIEETNVYSEITSENFGTWQNQIRQEETKARKPDYSTATKYFAIVEGKIAAVISCRWQIEKGRLLEWGGHIGYGVAPHYRGSHLAEKMVVFALEK